ncbi:hypothetical protein MBLNU459_g3110t1 [Dothideomycetes sp. NU459]
MASPRVTTPERVGESSPRRHTVAITEAQKQALIDNLQLEITERARKLRAQYAFQAQGLRARLELRINRIPQSLRKTSMHDLVHKYDGQNKPGPTSSSPQKPQLQHISQLSSSPAKNKGLKRSSDHFATAADKENAQPATAIDLANPKKRSKPNPAPPTAPAAAPSSPPVRSARPLAGAKKPNTILSPKSHNSRTLPRSPIKSPPPTKVPSRAPPPAAAAKPTRTASRATKRPATAEPAQSKRTRNSDSSDASAGTTIVRTAQPKAAAAASKKATAAAAKVDVPASAPAKKTGTLKSAFNSLTGSKRGKAAAAAAAAKEAAPATTAGGRVLRKRT